MIHRTKALVNMNLVHSTTQNSGNGADGHQIFISEYKAPDDFTCIWEKEQTTTIATTEYKKATERLFILPSN